MCTRYLTREQRAMEAYWRLRPSDAYRFPDLMRPRLSGPYIVPVRSTSDRAARVGLWWLIPWFAKTAKISYSTFNARFEEITTKASFKDPWARGQRCIIPASAFDEPNWETKKNVWWRFRRKDGAPWGLAGIYNTWTDKATGEIVESYSMLTLNADHHPIMSRMHKPDPDLPPDKQDKRSVVPIELADVDQWLQGTIEEARELVRLPAVELIDHGPAEN